MNTKLHAVTDANGRPISLFMTAGQVSDYIGAAALLDTLPKAQWLLGDRAMTQTGSGTPYRPRASRGTLAHRPYAPLGSRSLHLLLLRESLRSSPA